MSPCFFISRQVFLFSRLPQLSQNSSSMSGRNWASCDSLISFSWRARASLMVVMSLKWMVLGILRHFIPQVCRHSWKCISKALLPQQLKFPQISHLYSIPNPCSLYSQQGMGFPSHPSGRFLGLQMGASASSLSEEDYSLSSTSSYPLVCFFRTKFMVSQRTDASYSRNLEMRNSKKARFRLRFSFSSLNLRRSLSSSRGSSGISPSSSSALLCFLPMRWPTQASLLMYSFLQYLQYSVLLSSIGSLSSHPTTFPCEYFSSKRAYTLFSRDQMSKSGLDRLMKEARQLYTLCRQGRYLAWFLNFFLIGKSSNLSRFWRNQRQSCSLCVSLFSSITLQMLRNYRQIVCISTYFPLFSSELKSGSLKGGLKTLFRQYSTVFRGWTTTLSCFLNWSLSSLALSQKFCQMTSEGFFFSDGFNPFWPSIMAISSRLSAASSLMKLSTYLALSWIIREKLFILCSEIDRSLGLSWMASISLTMAFSSTSIDSRLERISQNQLPCISYNQNQTIDHPHIPGTSISQLTHWDSRENKFNTMLRSILSEGESLGELIEVGALLEEEVNLGVDGGSFLTLDILLPDALDGGVPVLREDLGHLEGQRDAFPHGFDVDVPVLLEDQLREEEALIELGTLTDPVDVGLVELLGVGRHNV